MEEKKNSSCREGVLQNKYTQIHLQYVSGQNDEWSYWLDIACGKPLLGSSDRDNGSKDVAELKKLNLRLFIRSNCQRYAVFPGVEFLRILFRL